MRYLKSLTAFLAVLVFAGCAEPVVFSEVLQQSKDQKIYTSYNLWYSDPLNMDALNVQQGSFIPAGTEIEPISTGRWNNEIRFRSIATGKEHCIKYSSAHRLCTMREFISYTFTTKTPDELFADIPETMMTRIRRGEAVPGMSIKAVTLAYGPPPACRTPDLRHGTWIYWRTPDSIIRLVMRDDRVRAVLDLEQDK
ncbi:MAG: hypothetical protein E7057_02155 [Lentisphaerae bacterium]|nr:hypothetical protein [Lentisphaerota bacterium]